ncbi:hypothetical protein MLD38_021796 [Melastoma candidum]|uniref:Uncharacterized protein n=1 Tax=Melastoma candidum TaxID=119954 RepID=A0ACB9QJ00_9MYRT|nr:hypothetical protein MLD38_021796 [Melastoma candidum]
MEEEDPTSIVPRLKLPRGPIIVAMKGHSCSGKTTLAREIVRSLRLCRYVSSLLRYDDIRASIQKTLPSSSDNQGLCNDVAYRILWRMASSHLSVYDEKIPRAIVLDSSLPNRGHLERLLGFRKFFDTLEFEPFFLVVECQPRDEVIWREWSESRLASSASPPIDEPSPWEEIQREISEHKEYSMDGALCLTVDTTDSTKSACDHAMDVTFKIMSSRILT